MPQKKKVCFEKFQFNLNKIKSFNCSVKKAYHNMSKIMHPDRASHNEQEQDAANEKFKTLKEAYEILIHPEKRKEYDETGAVFDEDRSDSSYIISDDQMVKCVQKYADSQQELQDIRQAYVDGRGNINYVIKNVPFIVAADKPRVTKIVLGTATISTISTLT